MGKPFLLATVVGLGLLLNVNPASAGNLSRLNQQLQGKTRMTLPGRLYVGDSNKLIVQGKPGAKIILYASPAQSGAQAPNGLPLNVGDNHQSFTATIGDNGVSSIPLTLPVELDGKTLFMDAVVYTQPDYSDLSRVDLLDAAGQVTVDNRVSIVKQNEKAGKGALLMPGMPGMNPQMIQQLQTLGEAQSDPRKKELLYDGTRENGRLLDRNSFIQMPGVQGNSGTP